MAQSNIVAVTAEGGSPTEAKELANAFAEQAIAQRTDELHRRIDAVLPRLRSQVEALPASDLTAQSLADEVAQLETLRAGDDPTMTLETPATEPSGPDLAEGRADARRRRPPRAGARRRGDVCAAGARSATPARGAARPDLPAPGARPDPARARPRRGAADQGEGHSSDDRGLPDAAHDVDCRPWNRLAVDPDHRAVRRRRQDDHGASPRRVAHGGRPPGDPDRGRRSPAVDRRGARDRCRPRAGQRAARTELGRRGPRVDRGVRAEPPAAARRGDRAGDRRARLAAGRQGRHRRGRAAWPTT